MITGAFTVGAVANTSAPEPVSPVTAAARLADDGVAKNVETPEPRPEMPVDTGRPVAFVRVAEAGVPSVGVTSVGEVANTLAPVPVSSVSAAAKLALVGVPKNVATPAASPETPDDMGRPVTLVMVPDAGVPRLGATNVGPEANTLAPEPVSSVSAAAKFALLGVARNVATFVPNPDMPVDTGRPVALVSVADVGVPRMGVTSVGEVANTFAPLPVSSVNTVARLALLGVARNVATPEARPDTPVDMGRPVMFVAMPEDGVPSAGVTSVGDVANTLAPEPVSSVSAAARLAEVGVAKNAATPVASSPGLTNCVPRNRLTVPPELVPSRASVSSRVSVS